MRLVDIEDLTDEEIESANAATQQFRGVSDLDFFNTRYVRDERGRLTEVRFYKSSEDTYARTVGVAVIDQAGQPALRVPR
jgi:YD repeat-containing protein